MLDCICDNERVTFFSPVFFFFFLYESHIPDLKICWRGLTKWGFNFRCRYGVSPNSQWSRNKFRFFCSDLLCSAGEVIPDNFRYPDFFRIKMKGKSARENLFQNDRCHINKSIYNNTKMTLQITFMSKHYFCLLYTSPSPRDKRQSRMPSSA